MPPRKIKALDSVQNPDTIKELLDVAGIGYLDKYPKKLSTKIQPVIVLNPSEPGASGSVTPSDIVRSIRDVNANAVNTIYTTSAGKTFFLTSVSFSISAGTGADWYFINAVIGGVIRNIVGISNLTGSNLDNEQVNLSFPNPIKIDGNTIIRLQQSSTLSTRYFVTIMGYEV